jgi:hypothetical protein
VNCGNHSFTTGKKRLREEAARQFVEVQVANPQLRQTHARSGVEATIEVRLRNGRSLVVRRALTGVTMVLDGIDVSKLKRVPRYARISHENKEKTLV